jgi:hypothetical protein
VAAFPAAPTPPTNAAEIKHIPIMRFVIAIS